MKKVLQKVWRVIRVIFGVELALAALGGVIMSVRSPVPGNVVLTVLCTGAAFLLLRRKRPKEAQISSASMVSTGQFEPVGPVSVRTEVSTPDVPEDILRDMRKHYSPMQAQNDARILQESFQLCQQTYNFETFFSRLQLTQRCALTLLQAKQAGCKISRQTVKACESALSAASALRLDFLDRIYTKQVTAAMQLKTPAGRRRRLEALLNELQEHDIDFMPIEDTYNEYLQRVQELMDE